MIDRIIITGDFNDGYSDENLKELVLLGRTLKQNGLAPKSCCRDVNYIFRGDYIFDTKECQGFYGTPKSASDQLMSDHHPVVFVEA